MAAGSRHGRGAEQISLRLPNGMRDRIKAVADSNNRSMNAEIIATLEEFYGSEGYEFTRFKFPSTTVDVDDLMKELVRFNANVERLKDSNGK